MMHKLLLLIIQVLLVSSSCVQSTDANTSITDNDINRPTPAIHDGEIKQEIPIGASILIETYPRFIKDYKDGKLFLSDGTSIKYDSGNNKSFLDKLDRAEPVDIFAWEYKKTKPNYCEDPGRGRCDYLFKLMYGSTSAEVQKRMETVDWFGTKVKFSSVNGAADSLRVVCQEIKKHQNLLKYTKTAGTYNWRKISGTNRQSAHSYGIAIDIGVAQSNYWKWDNPHKKETDKIQYNNRIPIELVDIFERHGFIWGGRWYHYDTMHFEFRPELLKEPY